VSHQNLLFAIFCPAQPLHLLFTVEEEEDEEEEVMVVAATLKTPNPADPLPSSGEVELE